MLFFLFFLIVFSTVDTAYKAARYRAFTLYKAENFFPR